MTTEAVVSDSNKCGALKYSGSEHLVDSCGDLGLARRHTKADEIYSRLAMTAPDAFLKNGGIFAKASICII